MNISDSGVTVSSVLQRGADLDEAKEFMKGGFYTNALQCTALRLGELSNAQGNIVDQELGKQISCLDEVLYVFCRTSSIPPFLFQICYCDLDLQGYSVMLKQMS